MRAGDREKKHMRQRIFIQWTVSRCLDGGGGIGDDLDEFQPASSGGPLCALVTAIVYLNILRYRREATKCLEEAGEQIEGELLECRWRSWSSLAGRGL